jgi:hypothetical protein
VPVEKGELTKGQKAGLARGTLGSREVMRYHPERMLEICEEIAKGRNLKDICLEDKYPHPATVRRWVLNFPEAAAMMTAAREISAFELEERAVHLADRLVAEKLDRDKIRSFEVAMNQYRWSAGKRNPRVFSDKLPPNFSVGVQITTPLDLGGGGTFKQIDGVYTIETSVPSGEEDARPPSTQKIVDNAESKPILRERARGGRRPVRVRDRVKGKENGDESV